MASSIYSPYRKKMQATDLIGLIAQGAQPQANYIGKNQMGFGSTPPRPKTHFLDAIRRSQQKKIPNFMPMAPTDDSETYDENSGVLGLANLGMSENTESNEGAAQMGGGASESQPGGMLQRLLNGGNSNAILGMATGLLNSSRKSTRPIGMGEALGSGLQGFLGGQMMDQRMQHQQTMTALAQQKMAMQQQQERLKQALMGQLLGDGGNNFTPTALEDIPLVYDPGTGLESTTGMPFTQAGQAIQEAEKQRAAQEYRQNMFTSMPFEQAALADYITGLPVMSIWGHYKTPQKFESGATYAPFGDPNNKTHIPKLDAGVTLDSNGNAVSVPGYGVALYVNAYAQKLAEEKARAETDLVQVDDGRGNMRFVPRSSLIGGGGSNYSGGTGGNVGGGAIAGRTPLHEKQALMQIERGEKLYSVIDENARKSQDTLVTLGALKQSLQGHEGGGFTPLRMKLGEYANSMGFQIDPKLGDLQFAQSLINQQAMRMRDPSSGGGLPGAISEKELDFLMKSVAGLTDTAEGASKIIQIQEFFAKRNLAMQKLANMWINSVEENGMKGLHVRDSGGKTFGDYWNAYIEKNPFKFQ